jgi:putative oxidoreductase
MQSGDLMLLRRVVRVLGASPLIVGGFDALLEPGGRPKALPNIKLPESPELVRLNGAVMFFGGLAFALGIKPKLVAIPLALSITATTLAGHQFWREEDPSALSQQRMQFLKNAAILAALLSELAA